MASKQRRASDPGEASAIAAQAAAQEVTPDISNAFLVALMEVATRQAGLDPQSSLLALSADEAVEESVQPLPGLRSTHTEEDYENFDKAKAFIQGQGDDHVVDPNDAKQGRLGNCYFIAGMIAVAQANPDAIRDLIVDNGDGTFDVTLYIRPSVAERPVPVTIRVDGQLPVRSAGVPLYAGLGDKSDGNVELWPALLEKALATHKGSYDLISGGNINKEFHYRGATELLTGKAEGRFEVASLDEDDVLLRISMALEEKKPVTCATLNMTDDEALIREATARNVYGNHAYVPMAVDLNGRTITLNNPWGSSHVTKLPVADFMRYYRYIRIGG